MKNKKLLHTCCAYLAVALIAAEIVLIVGSWAVSSVLPTVQMRSVLSGEGLRWLLGKTAENLTSPLLVWITLLATAFGVAVRCGIAEDLRQLRRKTPLSFRSRLGLMLVLVEALSVFVVIILLSAVPHAILLNVEGNLFPSSFSDSIIPLLAFTITLCATTYGITTSRIKSAVQWFDTLCRGISNAAPLFVIYILAAELFHTLRFVLCI